MSSTPRKPDDSTETTSEDPSLRERLHHGFEWVSQAVHEPRRNLDEVQQRVRNGFEIARFCLRHLAQDRAPQMAASLAFRTLFGILPVLVVVTVAARSLLGANFQNITGTSSSHPPTTSIPHTPTPTPTPTPSPTPVSKKTKCGILFPTS